MKRYLTEGQQATLLLTINRHSGLLARRDSAWTRLLASTGMRLNELVTMTAGDAEAALKNGHLFVPKEHRKGGKSGRGQDHSYLVTEPVRRALLDLLAVRSEQGHAPDPAAPLVMSRKHVGVTARAYEQRTAMWAELAGLGEKVSPHWFRHTRAMNIMRRSTASDPRGVVQGALGHASIASTGIYTQITKEDMEAALREVDGQPRLRKRELRRAYEGRVGA
ncbi:MAG: tyrosine-type recombinase/integrase [Pseudomonadota bacterium]